MVNASSDVLHIYLVLARAALLGNGRQGEFSPHIFTPALWCGCRIPIWVIFTRYSTPWIFACTGLSAVSDLDISLRALLPSLGSFSFSMSLVFSEGVTKWSAFFSIIPVQSGLSVPSDLLGDLLSCRQVFDCLTACLAALLLGYWLYKISWFSWGFFKVLRRTAPRLRAISWEFCSLSSVFLVSRQRRFWQADSFLSDRILV